MRKLAANRNAKPAPQTKNIARADQRGDPPLF
jgi:hypothetical protein